MTLTSAQHEFTQRLRNTKDKNYPLTFSQRLILDLEADAARYKAALENILSLNGGHHSETNYLLNEAQGIARNALKEGM